MPTAKSELCGGIQGFVGASGLKPYRTVYLGQGNEEICSQLCIKDESCVTFGLQVEPYSRTCSLFTIPRRN
jgi:hypothetical protein